MQNSAFIAKVKERITVKIAISLFALVLLIVSNVYYITQIITESIQPVLATWILFCVAVSLSLRTYLSSKNSELLGNIANASDFLYVWTVLACILLFGRNVRIGFTTFEYACLGATGGILVYWLITKKHAMSNIALQTIMTVAYFPMFIHLWFAQSNTESLVAWVIAWIAGGFALASSILYRRNLGILYASRAFILMTGVILLILRLKFR